MASAPYHQWQRRRGRGPFVNVFVVSFLTLSHHTPYDVISFLSFYFSHIHHTRAKTVAEVVGTSHHVIIIVHQMENKEKKTPTQLRESYLGSLTAAFKKLFTDPGQGHGEITNGMQANQIASILPNLIYLNPHTLIRAIYLKISYRFEDDGKETRDEKVQRAFRYEASRPNEITPSSYYAGVPLFEPPSRDKKIDFLNALLTYYMLVSKHEERRR